MLGSNNHVPITIQNPLSSFIIHLANLIYYSRNYKNRRAKSLVDQSGGSSGLVLPVWWQDSNSSVVSGQSVDSRFDQNQSELRVLVLSVLVQVLSDRDSLLDQEVQILWDLWSQTVGLQDSQDLVTSDNSSLGDTVSISQDNTNLRWSQTLSGVLDDLLNNFVSRELEPRRSVSRVWKSGGGDSLTLNNVSMMSKT